MALFGFFLAFFIMAVVIRMIMEKYPFRTICVQRYSVRRLLIWMFRNGETRKRLLITLGIIIFLRLMFFIPLPGIDIPTLQAFFESIISRSNPGINFFVYGASARLSIAALGVMPFISACLLLQFASILIPPLRRLSFGGENGRNRITKYTYILTIILSLIQGFCLSSWLQNPNNFNGMTLVPGPGFIFVSIAILTLTAGVAVLLFGATLINRYGIGNGVPLIIISSIIFKIPAMIHQSIILVESGQIPSYLPALWGVIFIGAIYGFFYVTRLVRNFNVQNSISQKFSIPFRPTIVGTIPLSWAVSLVTLPATIALFRWGRYANASSLQQDSIVHNILLIIFIFFFTYLYILVVFTPGYALRLMRQYRCSFLGSDSAEESKNFKKGILKVLAITALFLVGISFLPRMLLYIFNTPFYSLASLICGLELAVIIGVFTDILSQLEFFRKKKASKIKDWNICYIAFDEIEAQIKKGYLESRGLPALIKPFRYTWGMPIRTAIDQYQIYVAADKKEQARDLILTKNE